MAKLDQLPSRASPLPHQQQFHHQFPYRAVSEASSTPPSTTTTTSPYQQHQHQQIQHHHQQIQQHHQQIQQQMLPHLQQPPIPIMLRLSPLTSTPFLLDPSTTSYEEFLRQIEEEIYMRATEITEGRIFEGFYIEWDRSSGDESCNFPSSSVLDKRNYMSTMALLRARKGRDVLCVKVRVAGAGMLLRVA